MDKRISLFGSTGSIGTQTPEVAKVYDFSVYALVTHSNIQLLEEQIRGFRPTLAAVFGENAARDLKERVHDLPVHAAAGVDGFYRAASIREADIVCNAVMGMTGLLPTTTAIPAREGVALASKEALVTGSALAMKAMRENGMWTLPVGSEHSAIFQCLQGCPRSLTVARLILTTSGRPLFGRAREELEQATPGQALRHPNWSMDARVTIDSTTMMSRGLEILEASWPLSTPVSQIDVMIHHGSIVHPVIEYQDYSVLAQLSVPGMHISIQYTLTWPERLPFPIDYLSLTGFGTLSFYPSDKQAFPRLGLAKRVAQQGGLTPVAMNGASEEAVKLLPSDHIPFLQTLQLAEAAMKRQAVGQPGTPQRVLTMDQNVQNFILESVQQSPCGSLSKYTCTKVRIPPLPEKGEEIDDSFESGTAID